MYLVDMVGAVMCHVRAHSLHTYHFSCPAIIAAIYNTSPESGYGWRRSSQENGYSWCPTDRYRAVREAARFHRKAHFRTVGVHHDSFIYEYYVYDTIRV